MCGISCIVALDGHHRRAHQQDKQTIEDKLRKSLEQIRHRGPDSTGTWIGEDGRVALGHVRLDINDLSPAGCQPLHSTDNKVHAVVNGEIYDYDRLRREMEDKIDYKFQGTSDSELVLALYKYYDGVSFLDNIRGEFSICLFDSDRELFVAVRDRYGIKPLFWTIQEGQLLVAAEMKAFLPLGWKPEWDFESIVGGDFQIGNSTILKNIQKVRPGHFLVSKYFGPVQEQRYWDSRYPDKHVKDPRTEAEMIQGVRDRLIDSIKERLRADVKVGVSLSGGIDSSVVAGMVNHLLRQGHQIGSESVNDRLSCFGIAFDEDSGFDESSTANRTAEFLGVKFYKKHMTEEELARFFADATWHDEQPNPDLNFIGTYALSELFHDKGFRVNINGQGADEIFGGYNIFLPDFLREPDTTFDGDGGDVTMTEDDRIAELQRLEDTINRVYYGGQLDISGNSVACRQLNNILTPVLMAAAFPRLPFEEEFLPFPTTVSDQQLLTYTESIVDGARGAAATTKWHPLHTAQYVFIKGHLQNLLLSNLGDRGEMAHSIEGRTPFLDHHLTEYVDGLPPNVKIRRNTKGEWVEKYILREAGRPFITDEVYQKQKHPYSAPLRFPRGGPMYNLLRELVTEDNISKLGFVRHDGIGKLVDDAFETTNKDTSTTKFRLVICLAQWVVLQRRFGVKTAISEDGGQDLEEAGTREEGIKDVTNIMIG